MNYQKIYDSLIDKAKTRIDLEGYFERHHVIPKSLGGTDDESNLVNLTAREHFVSHCLLAKIHGGSQWLPVIYFKNTNSNKFNSRMFEIAKHKISEYKKSKPTWNKGKTGGSWSAARRESQKYVVHRGLSEETKQKHRKQKTAKHAENIRLAKLNQSEETKRLIGLAHKGRVLRPETVEKMRLAKLGTKQSEETRMKRSVSLLKYHSKPKGELHV